MAYSFQPYYPGQYQVPNDSNIWVQGEAGARAYLVAPGNTVRLWDSEAQTIYIKSADAAGIPSMRILDYTIRDTAPQRRPESFSEPGAKTPTAEDIKALQSQIDELKNEIGGLKRDSE